MQMEHNDNWTPGNRPGGDMGALLDACGYLSVVIGYLYAVLSAERLSVLNFALFTLLNVAWIGLFWLVSSRPCPPSVDRMMIGAMAALAVGAQLMTWMGLGFDWLLPVVTISILTFAFAFSWRTTIITGSAMAIVTIATLAGPQIVTVSGLEQLGRHLPSMLSVIPAYIFVLIFTVVLQRQQVLREQAEGLAEELARSKVELEDANEELRRFSAQVEELAVTRERNRMAREIHDTLGHYLTLLAVQLETAGKLRERGDPRLQGELVEARRVVAECLMEVRRSVAALRPAELSSASFGESLSHLVGELEAVAPNVEITFDLEGPTQDLGPELRVALYRCAQEALTNVRKHARATKVLLRVRADDEVVELTVLDNGIGPDSDGAEPGAPGVGLIGMRERIALLGGTVKIGPEPERGWRVEVRAPRGVSEAPATVPTGMPRAETDAEAIRALARTALA
ncbi:MAG TPA: sensor histidine kinase [Ktedonobacterales bacterium]